MKAVALVARRAKRLAGSGTPTSSAVCHRRRKRILRIRRLHIVVPPGTRRMMAAVPLHLLSRIKTTVVASLAQALKILATTVSSAEAAQMGAVVGLEKVLRSASCC